MIKANESYVDGESSQHCRTCNHRGLPAERFTKPEPMVRCAACGTVQVKVLPTEQALSEFYGRQYLDDYTAGMAADRFLREMPLRHAAKLKLVCQIASPTRLLDVGCGEGMFVAQAQAAGIDAMGCDYGLRSNYPQGVTVEQGNIDERLPFPSDHFDVVTSWAVLEHVRNPRQAVSEIFRVLRPGGYTFWDTPLASDWCELLVAARSHWFCPPEHLHVFSARGLRLLAEKAGLHVIRQSPFFERTIFRLVARRLRNVAVGTAIGGTMKVFARRKWTQLRQQRVTGIGDIQLLVARKPNCPQPEGAH